MQASNGSWAGYWMRDFSLVLLLGSASLIQISDTASLSWAHVAQSFYLKLAQRKQHHAHGASSFPN